MTSDFPLLKNDLLLRAARGELLELLMNLQNRF